MPNLGATVTPTKTLHRKLVEVVVPLADKSRCYVMVPEDLTPDEGRRLLEVLAAWVPTDE